MAGRGRRAGKSVAAKNQSAAARRAQQRLGKTVVTSAKDAPPEEADDAPNLKKLPLLKKTGVTTITKTAPGSSEQHVHSDSDSDILEITEVKPSRSRSPSPSQGLVYTRPSETQLAEREKGEEMLRMLQKAPGPQKKVSVVNNITAQHGNAASFDLNVPKNEQLGHWFHSINGILNEDQHQIVVGLKGIDRQKAMKPIHHKTHADRLVSDLIFIADRSTDVANINSKNSVVQHRGAGIAYASSQIVMQLPNLIRIRERIIANRVAMCNSAKRETAVFPKGHHYTIIEVDYRLLTGLKTILRGIHVGQLKINRKTSKIPAKKRNLGVDGRLRESFEKIALAAVAFKSTVTMDLLPEMAKFYGITWVGKEAEARGQYSRKNGEKQVFYSEMLSKCQSFTPMKFLSSLKGYRFPNQMEPTPPDKFSYEIDSTTPSAYTHHSTGLLKPPVPPSIPPPPTTGSMVLPSGAPIIIDQVPPVVNHRGYQPPLLGSSPPKQRRNDFQQQGRNQSDHRRRNEPPSKPIPGNKRSSNVLEPSAHPPVKIGGGAEARELQIQLAALKKKVELLSQAKQHVDENASTMVQQVQRTQRSANYSANPKPPADRWSDVGRCEPSPPQFTIKSNAPPVTHVYPPAPPVSHFNEPQPNYHMQQQQPPDYGRDRASPHLQHYNHHKQYQHQKPKAPQHFDHSQKRESFELTEPPANGHASRDPYGYLKPQPNVATGTWRDTIPRPEQASQNRNHPSAANRYSAAGATATANSGSNFSDFDDSLSGQQKSSRFQKFY